MKRILITGFGGFIGYSLLMALKDKFQITALDNFSETSNYLIKKARAGQLGISDLEAFKREKKHKIGNSDFCYADLCNRESLEEIFSSERFDLVIHLAALTGVRQSLLNPAAYIDSNVQGFVSLLECVRKFQIRNVIYASSSSVYGMNKETPCKESQPTDLPISVYAASKKSNELLAHVYSSLYNINLTGLRFFTVYGPWTRPDMAAYLFMKAIKNERPIELFNEGKMIRDFTYIDDVTKTISLLMEKMEQEKIPGNRIFNVGNHQPVYTVDFLKKIESAMNKKAVINFKPIQPGDMPATNALTGRLFDYIGFKPGTELEAGIKEMVKWFTQYEN